MTRTVSAVALFSAILATTSLSASVPTPEVQIAGAVAAAPEDRRDGATVLGYSAEGELVTLRKGLNEIVCLADTPGDDRFQSSCYHQSLEPFMRRGRELRAEGVPSGETLDARHAEADVGKLELPESPATLYNLGGPLEIFDPETGELSGGHWVWSVYMPYATPESTGLPTTPQAPGAPWIMRGGTASSHLMISSSLASPSLMATADRLPGRTPIRRRVIVRTVSRIAILISVVLGLASIATAQDAARFQNDFPADELTSRRARVLETVGDDALVLLQGAPNVRGFSVFRQSNEMYYLTGIEVPHAYLLLDGRAGRSYLYLPHRHARRESGEGKLWSAEDAEELIALTGVDEVHGIDLLPHRLWRYLLKAPYPTVYTMMSPAEGRAQSRDELLIGLADAISDPWDDAVSREGRFLNLLRERYPQFPTADLTPVLDAMRIVKSPGEIDLIRRASELAALGIMEAIRSTEPGLFEYQLDAAARYVYLVNGARSEAYRSITAGGTNAFFGHYYRNDSALESGDLILMDAAPDYRYYVSDVARMWPVNGTFSPAQRELYGWILAYYDTLLPKIRPGVTADQILDEAAAEMRLRFEATEFSKPEYRAAAEGTLTFRGHLSHPVGLAVHDVGDYRSQPLVPGVVFSVDPMLWVPEERLYVRVEDVGVVTEDGFENFSSLAPTRIEAIEELMREPGILQLRPPRP